MDMEALNERQEFLESQTRTASARLKRLSGGGTFNLTPDHVKASYRWKRARQQYQQSHDALRAFNKKYAKALHKYRRAKQTA